MALRDAKMQHPPPYLSLAPIFVRAVPAHLALRLNKRCAAFGATGRQLLCAQPGRALFKKDADNLGYDFSRFFNNHTVTGQDAESLHFVKVVKGGARHG